MSGDLSQLGVYGLFAYLVIKEGFSIVKSSLVKKNGNGNGSSGERSVDYWRMEFRQAIDERVGRHLIEQSEVLSDIRDGINRLVILSERLR